MSSQVSGASPEVQARIDELAEKSTEGEITAEEQAEYDSYIHAIDFIAVLQAQARLYSGKNEPLLMDAALRTER